MAAGWVTYLLSVLISPSGIVAIVVVVGYIIYSLCSYPPAKPRTLHCNYGLQKQIQHQVSQCTCANKFKVSKVAEGQYRFGDSQKLRLVRILRSTVMMRVGGGWEPLEEFLLKHDPCRTSGHTNADLRSMLTGNHTPGLRTASFTSKRVMPTAATNTVMRKVATEDSHSKLVTRSSHSEVDARVKKPEAKDRTPLQAHQSHATSKDSSKCAH